VTDSESAEEWVAVVQHQARNLAERIELPDRRVFFEGAAGLELQAVQHAALMRDYQGLVNVFDVRSENEFHGCRRGSSGSGALQRRRGHASKQLTRAAMNI